MDETVTNAEELIRRWEVSGISVLSGSNKAIILKTFASIGMPISADVIRFYMLTGGTGDSMDGNCVTFWPLSRVQRENIDSEMVAFADYLIDSHRYYFCYQAPEVSCVFGGDPPRKLAETVDEFFGLYLSKPESVEAWSLDRKAPHPRLIAAVLLLVCFLCVAWFSLLFAISRGWLG